MKKSSLTGRLIPVLLLVALMLACGTVFAYMFQKVDEKTVTFTPVTIGGDAEVTKQDDDIAQIAVKNTSGVKSYIRVCLVTYWIDAHGNVAPISSKPLNFTYDSNKWRKGSDNLYYYRTPVETNASTTYELIESGILALGVDGEYRQVVDVLVESIQADPVDAVKESWNVTLNGTTIDTVP